MLVYLVKVAVKNIRKFYFDNFFRNLSQTVYLEYKSKVIKPEKNLTIILYFTLAITFLAVGVRLTLLI